MDQSVDGRSQWETSFGQTTSSIATPPTTGGNWTVTTTNPDGTSAVQKFSDTRLEKVEQKAAGGAIIASTTMTYDPHGRLLTQTDARTGATTFAYDNADQITSETAPDPSGGSSPLVTAYGYDSICFCFLLINAFQQMIWTLYFDGVFFMSSISMG